MSTSKAILSKPDPQLYGFIVAGHDTTGTTLCWAVKLLADHGAAQSLLRDELRSRLANAISEVRQPSVEELTAHMPYLDAVVEEVLRVGPTAPIGSRQATKDTTILGYAIPKDTIVLYLNQGPSYLLPCHEVDERQRSVSSQDEKTRGRAKAWDPKDAAQFKPERWLRGDDQGVVFDAKAGPMGTFGMGLRGCFGRRLAYIKMRIMIAMLVWNFELLPCAEELSGYEKKLVLTGKPLKCYVQLRRATRSD